MEYQLDCVENYTVKDAIGGIQVYDGFGDFVCELSNDTIDNYMYEEEIDEDTLYDAIKKELEIENFLQYSLI